MEFEQHAALAENVYSARESPRLEHELEEGGVNFKQDLMIDDIREKMGDFMTQGNNALDPLSIDKSKIFRQIKGNSYDIESSPISLKSHATMNDVFLPIKAE